MPVDKNSLGYSGRVIGSTKVAGLCQFATQAQAGAGFRNDRAIAASEISKAVGDQKRLFDPMNLQPISAKVGGGAATGTAGDENVLQMGAASYEYHILGTQTILAPKMGVGGVDMNLDQTADDGIEYVPGANNLAGKYAFTVGTDSEFEARLSFSIADVSGSDDCLFGFRKVQAYQAAVDDYTDMAAFNVIAGAINIETILNNAATDTTDTTDTVADGVTVELKVRVSKTGAVKFFIDGAAPTVTTAFTFDSGDVVIPFFFFLNDTDVAGAVIFQELEVGRVLK